MSRSNTTADVLQEANKQLTDAEGRRKKLIKVYREEPKKPMYLSPMYRPYFGNVMTVSINGVAIYFKVDGTTQMIPETFANEITAKRMAVDTILTRQSRLANIPANAESAPGELNLF